MPYISKDKRPRIDAAVNNLVEAIKQEAVDGHPLCGLVNYAVITFVCNVYTDFGTKKWRYHIINDIIGVLSAIQLEFYRRIAAPYEDSKAKDNEVDCLRMDDA